jgi:cytochrome c oxidase subunit 2
MDQKMWFKAKQPGSFDIVCAELCGWGHYKMKGRVHLMTRSAYEAKLEDMRKEQNTMRVVATNSAE